jgi:hypothetical protein
MGQGELHTSLAMLIKDPNKQSLVLNLGSSMLSVGGLFNLMTLVLVWGIVGGVLEGFWFGFFPLRDGEVMTEGAARGSELALVERWEGLIDFIMVAKKGEKGSCCGGQRLAGAVRGK